MNTKDFSWQFRLAAALRTPVLVFVVVPLSGLWNAYRKIRTSLRGARLDTESEQHAKRVEFVKSQLEDWDKGGRQGRLRTARPNWRASKSSRYFVTTSVADHDLIYLLVHILLTVISVDKTGQQQKRRSLD